MKTLFIFAGEASGDLHGSLLMRTLKKEDPSYTFYGVGGPRMREEQLECLHRMEEFQVMGLTDVVASLPRLCTLFYTLRAEILRRKPAAAVLIDYPGFNLRLAKSLRKGGYKGKIVQYVCPTVWAHGKHRIEFLERYFDLVLSIYPFEPPLFSHTTLPVVYIGNPLVDAVRAHTYDPAFRNTLGIPQEKSLIALFPGSRQGEIKRHAPLQIAIAERLAKQFPSLHFALSCAQEKHRPLLKPYLERSSLRTHSSLISPRHHYDLMRTCAVAIAKSGTVTLELALHEVPTLVHYDLSAVNYLFAKHVLKLALPHYCIVNILRSEILFPEYVGRKLPLDPMTKTIGKMYADLNWRENIQSGCRAIRTSLGPNPSHKAAAETIIEALKC